MKQIDDRFIDKKSRANKNEWVNVSQKMSKNQLNSQLNYLIN